MGPWLIMSSGTEETSGGSSVPSFSLSNSHVEFLFYPSVLSPLISIAFSESWRSN